MVEADRVDRVVAGHVVLVGRVVSVPGDDVERGVVEGRDPETAEEFGDDVEAAFAIVEGGYGGEEIARVSEAVGADGAEIGQTKGLAVVFADVASGFVYY